MPADANTANFQGRAMKLKTVVLAATLLATCCCALTSYGRAPTGKAKPKKKPATGSVSTNNGTIITAANIGAVSGDIYTLPPGAFYALNRDYTIGGADLQVLLNYLKSGGGSEIAVTTTTDINGDYTNTMNPASNLESLLINRDPVANSEAVPEPTSAILAGCGLVVLLAVRRRLQA